MAGKVVRSLRRALRGDAGQVRGEDVRQPSLAFDRLAQALQWARLRRKGPCHPALARLCAFAELDAAAWRAVHGLRAAAGQAPGLRSLARAGQDGLVRAEPDALYAAARALLAHADAPAAVLQVVSGLDGAALLLRQQGAALVRHGATRG